MKMKSRIDKSKCFLTQEQIIAKLESVGLNATAQRIAICQYVFCQGDHPTADDVKVWIDGNFSKMSLATVYNTLSLLVQTKLLKEFKFPHSDKVMYDKNLLKHYHFYDEDSGTITDLPLDQVEVITKLNKTHKINDIEVIVRGSKR